MKKNELLFEYKILLYIYKYINSKMDILANLMLSKYDINKLITCDDETDIILNDEININIKQSLNFYKKLISSCSVNPECILQTGLPIHFKNIKIEIKKSKIHGNGVFATKDIKKNEIITLYPADIIMISDKTKNGCGILLGKLYKERGNKDIINNFNKKELKGESLNNPYLINLNENIKLIGDPYKQDNLNYVGHLINDGCKHNRTEKSKKIYLKIAYLKCNVFFKNYNNIALYCYAYKDIKKGDELYFPYGTKYWDIY